MKQNHNAFPIAGGTHKLTDFVTRNGRHVHVDDNHIGLVTNDLTGDTKWRVEAMDYIPLRLQEKLNVGKKCLTVVEPDLSPHFPRFRPLAQVPCSQVTTSVR